MTNYLYSHDTQTIKALEQVAADLGSTLVNDTYGTYTLRTNHVERQAHDYPSNVCEVVRELAELHGRTHAVESALLNVAQQIAAPVSKVQAWDAVYHVRDEAGALVDEINELDQLADYLSAYEIAQHLLKQGVQAEVWYSQHNGWSVDWEQ